ncbi:MAG TPA: hypothetical protein VE422_08190 [Terriglobia bacterium]|nr:hypothetical protein [Terriglobia bacterium]
MKERLLFCTVFLLCAVVCAHASGEYRTVQIESLQITMDSEWAAQGAPGYMPVRFDITNLGDSRSIEIVGQGNRWSPYGGEIGESSLRQTLRLNRGDRLRLTIPVPVFAENENFHFQIRERGRVLQAFNYFGFRSGMSPEDSPVLIVADPASAVGAMTTKWPREIRWKYYGSGVPPKMDFILEPARLPENWLGFTSVRAVLIGPTEWEELSEVQKNALLTWTACGGDLIFADGDLKALFHETQNRPAGKWQDKGAPERYFFGHIHFPKSTEVNYRGLTEILAATRVVQNPSYALPANRAADWGRIEEHGFRLPIPGVNAVPARAYLAILILFSVLIGPVNYLFLWRKRQQVLLVLTVPLISGLFIAVLAGYAVAGEGFGIWGRAATFTVLDQATKQAATRASVSLYAAGMAPAGGMRFPRDMAVYPIGTDGPANRQEQSLDLTDLQRFSAGIIQARSPSNFEEIGFRPARERLSFTSDSDRVSVINGLGATVTQLFYRAGGKIHTLGGPLRAGEKGILQTGPGNAPEVFFSPLLSPQKLHDVMNNQADGSYLAVLERSPFWEPGIPKLDERGSLHLVLGYAGGEP